jgi:hypothetical protein
VTTDSCREQSVVRLPAVWSSPQVSAEQPDCYWPRSPGLHEDWERIEREDARLLDRIRDRVTGMEDLRNA